MCCNNTVYVHSQKIADTFPKDDSCAISVGVERKYQPVSDQDVMSQLCTWPPRTWHRSDFHIALPELKRVHAWRKIESLNGTGDWEIGSCQTQTTQHMRHNMSQPTEQHTSHTSHTLDICNTLAMKPRKSLVFYSGRGIVKSGKSRRGLFQMGSSLSPSLHVVAFFPRGKGSERLSSCWLAAARSSLDQDKIETCTDMQRIVIASHSHFIQKPARRLHIGLRLLDHLLPKKWLNSNFQLFKKLA